MVALVALSFILASIPAVAADMKSGKAAGKKGVCSNPIGDTIAETPSINEMRSKPARELSYVSAVLGNKVPTQTDNSGKRK